MAVAVIDPFTRADNVSLGAGYAVDPFSETGASPQIVSNAVVCHAVTSYNLVAYTALVLPASQGSRMKIVTAFTAGAFRALYLLVRVAAGAGYMCQWAIDGSVTFFKYPGGSQVGAAASGVTMADGDVATFTAVGARLAMLRNGVEVASVTDGSAPLIAAGSPGFGIYDQTVKAGVFDDFGAGALQGAAGPGLHIPVLQPALRS